MDLTDEQWAVVEPLLPKPVKRTDGKGKPRVDDRAILNGILWVMRTGLLLIAPHKSHRKKPKTQDDRELRRYRRRWKVERLFAWLKNYRRILVRYDRELPRFRSFGLYCYFC